VAPVHPHLQSRGRRRLAGVRSGHRDRYPLPSLEPTLIAILICGGSSGYILCFSPRDYYCSVSIRSTLSVTANMSVSETRFCRIPLVFYPIEPRILSIVFLPCSIWRARGRGRRRAGSAVREGGRASTFVLHGGRRHDSRRW
jgi:hypothetical protein